MFNVYYEPCEQPIATFFSRAAAEAFAKAENDAVQAEVATVVGPKVDYPQFMGSGQHLWHVK